jgi:hypothetical protein
VRKYLVCGVRQLHYHDISRTFIYDQPAAFEKIVDQLLGPPVLAADPDVKRDAAEVMASLRLEGKCGVSL